MDADDNNSNPLYLEFNFDASADELAYHDDGCANINSYMEEIYQQTQHAHLPLHQQQYCPDGGATSSANITDPNGADVIQLQYVTGNDAYATMAEFGGHQLYATDDDTLDIKQIVSQLKQEGVIASAGEATVYEQRVIVAAPRMIRKPILVPRPAEPQVAVETRHQGQQTRQRKQQILPRNQDLWENENDFFDVARAKATKVKSAAAAKVVDDAPGIVKEPLSNSTRQLRSRTVIDAQGIATPVRPSKRVFEKPPRSKKRLLTALNTHENAA